MEPAVKRATPEASSVKVKVETANLISEVHKHHVLWIFAGTKQLLNTLSDDQPSPKCSWRQQRYFFCLRFLWTMGTMHGTLMGLSSVHYVLQNQKDANYTASLISINIYNSATDWTRINCLWYVVCKINKVNLVLKWRLNVFQTQPFRQFCCFFFSGTTVPAQYLQYWAGTTASDKRAVKPSFLIKNTLKILTCECALTVFWIGMHTFAVKLIVNGYTKCIPGNKLHSWK